ncbi:hypothetical protein CDO51_09040 [Natranaerobius trueperi]|uniref:Uncharacterized protein n=1 Tax=Natranaerobius trueperi TaxID=759412 RepID=A0A226BYE4_9FIRM|nr:hypothetical protein CDO51_09040 [Natranaerobius trueperi]
MQKLDDKDKKWMLEENAVAILFPYLRALIITFTSNVNVPPLILLTTYVKNLAKKTNEI